jgi:hypothetical protein
MSELTTAVCSIATTRRRRFFWAAWWTAEPSPRPFRKPDAANGGARTRAAALAEAERAAGRSLTVVDAYWARAWMCLLRGQPAPPPPDAHTARRAARPRQQNESAWAVLGLTPGASPLSIRRAFHAKALETHPDQGGDAERFRAVMRAFERLTHRRKPRRHRHGKQGQPPEPRG